MNRILLRKICITGGIACGKSSVGAMLRESGVRIIDADEVCHELLRKDRAVIAGIVSVFGKGVLSRSGGIDRHILGRIIFADDEKREKLNALLHPRARQVINAWLKTRRASAGPVVAIIPLLYEVGWERGWEAVICVAAPLSFQMARLKMKGLSEKEARRRIVAQMPLAEKINRADYVIFNAGTVADLRQQTMLVFRNIKEKAEKRYERKR